MVAASWRYSATPVNCLPLSWLAIMRLHCLMVSFSSMINLPCDIEHHNAPGGQPMRVQESAPEAFPECPAPFLSTYPVHSSPPSSSCAILFLAPASAHAAPAPSA